MVTPKNARYIRHIEGVPIFIDIESGQFFASNRGDLRASTLKELYQLLMQSIPANVCREAIIQYGFASKYYRTMVRWSTEKNKWIIFNMAGDIAFQATYEKVYAIDETIWDDIVKETRLLDNLKEQVDNQSLMLHALVDTLPHMHPPENDTTEALPAYPSKTMLRKLERKQRSREAARRYHEEHNRGD